MVSSAFPGHDLPITVKELATTTHPKSWNQQHLTPATTSETPTFLHVLLFTEHMSRWERGKGKRCELLKLL